MTRYSCRAGSAVTAIQAAMPASKTASNRAERTHVVLHPGGGPNSSGWARFFDGCFAHWAQSVTDTESEPRFTPRACSVRARRLVTQIHASWERCASCGYRGTLGHRPAWPSAKAHGLDSRCITSGC
jgi:hypothetical protein